MLMDEGGALESRLKAVWPGEITRATAASVDAEVESRVVLFCRDPAAPDHSMLVDG